MRTIKRTLKEFKTSIFDNKDVGYNSEIFNDNNIIYISDFIGRICKETYMLTNMGEDIDLNKILQDDFNFNIFKIEIDKMNILEEISKIPNECSIFVLENMGIETIKEMMKSSIKLGREHFYMYIGTPIKDLEEMGYVEKNIPKFPRKYKLEEIIGDLHFERSTYLYIRK